MIAKLYDQNHVLIGWMKNIKSPKLETTLSNGDKVLSFSWYIQNRYQILPEYYIETDADEFVVKEKSYSGKGWHNIVATLNLEELEGKLWDSFKSEDCTAQEVADYALTGTGWQCVSEIPDTKKRSISLTNCSTYDIIARILEAYIAEVEYDTLHKKIYLREKNGADKGVYFIRGLNLKELNDAQTSYDFVTQMIPYGADGLTIRSVEPSGNDFIENFQYSSKKKARIWEDASYTDAQELYDASVYYLDELSKPSKTYSCKIIDLAKQSEKYSILEYGIGDTIMIIDGEKGIRDRQRITKMTEYPDTPEKNTCELSNTVLSFADLQKSLQAAAECLSNITVNNGTVKGSAVDSIDATQVIGLDRYIGEDMDDLTVANLSVTNSFGALTGTIGTLTAQTETVASLTVSTRADIALEYVTESHVENLYGKYGKFNTIESENLSALEAKFDKLEANYGKFNVLVTNFMSTEYAFANFSNVGTESVQELFGKSGYFTSIVVSDGKYTGELTAVRINADDITSGTLKTDRLLLTGDDGIVYNINVTAAGLTKTELSEEEANKLLINGKSIVAHSITVNELTVDDIIGAHGRINLAKGTFNYGGQIIWDGSKLTIAAGNITSICNGLYDSYGSAASAGESAVSAVKQNVISYINQSPESVTISASKINLTGAVSIQSLDSNSKSSLISSVTTYYVQTDSDTITPESGWSTTPPAVVDGKYIWQQTKTIYLNGNEEYSTPVCITGATGATGIGVSKMTTLYYCSNSATAPSAGPTTNVTVNSSSAYNQWNLRPATWTNTYKYYYTCTQTLYTSGTYSCSTPVYDTALTQAVTNATNATTAISNWCSANDTTKIDGAKIYTGSITADKINVTDLFSKNITYTGYLTTNSSRTSYNAAVIGMTMDANGIGGYGSSSAYWNLSKNGVLTAAGAKISGTISTTESASSILSIYEGTTLKLRLIGTSTSTFSASNLIFNLQNSTTDGATNNSVYKCTINGGTIECMIDGDDYFSVVTGYGMVDLYMPSTLAVGDLGYRVNRAGTTVWMGVGSGGSNHGLYSSTLGKWIVYGNSTSIYLNGSAASLTTARTLTIGSTGKSFNGTANVSWSLSEIGAAASSHSHSYLPLSGGTLTGNLIGTTLYCSYGMRFGTNSYSTEYGITTLWKDSDNHYIVSRGSDGLQAYFGWAGSSSYSTVSNIRARTVRYTNSSGTTTLSDERIKNSFKSLSEYDEVFDNLKPCAFRYNSGSSGRFHFGFKAQDVEKALLENGFTTQDFAGFINLVPDKDDEEYDGIEDPKGLIYTEFTAWNTHMIQKNRKSIMALTKWKSEKDIQIETMQQQIYSLQFENQSLKMELEKLKTNALEAS